MVIHIVEQEDSIASVAQEYGVPISRLMQDNGLDESRELVPGETLVIAYPTQTYIVKEGDVLSKIAEDNGITLIQLLRNNPSLNDREYIIPGEELIISYDNTKGRITVNGYTNNFIDEDTLLTTLPYLTYLSVFGNSNTVGGKVITIDDSRVVDTAKEYKVIPIMMLSTMSAQGLGNFEISYSIVNDINVTKNNIQNVLSVLRKKDYYGVNMSYQFLRADNVNAYEKFTERTSKGWKQEGFLVFVTVSENFHLEADKMTFEKIDYTNIGSKVDGITLLNYNWGYSYGPPGPVMSVYMMRQFLDYIVTKVSPGKIELGIPVIKYDWELPYVIGITKANSLTLDSALTLAGDVGATIQFDEVSQTPYFTYVDNKRGIPIQHIVWFMDARSINAIMELITEYGFRGTGIWNIMNYYPQLWLVINSQYEIETLLT